MQGFNVSASWKKWKVEVIILDFSGRGVIIPFEEWPFLRNQTIEDFE